MNNTSLRPLAIPAISVALLVAAAPAAALHRCTGPDGKVSYTEFQCENNATASGVAIHDSSGMDINKRTNSFSYTPPPPAPRSTSRATSQPTPTPTRPGSNATTTGDVVKKGTQYESKKGDSLDRPPTFKVVKPEDKEREQAALDRQWSDYRKQQSELKQKYMDQPLTPR